MRTKTERTTPPRALHRVVRVQRFDAIVGDTAQPNRPQAAIGLGVVDWTIPSFVIIPGTTVSTEAFDSFDPSRSGPVLPECAGKLPFARSAG